MASPQELQNALMLKKANPNLTTEQVVNQARVPVTTTSNQDQLAANRARVQSQIASGERPAVGTSVTPQAGQTQAPVSEIDKAVTKYSNIIKNRDLWVQEYAKYPTPIQWTITPSGATMNADWTVTPATTTPAIPSTPTNQVTTGVWNWNQNILENPDIKRAMDDIKNWTISSFANDSIEWGKKTTPVIDKNAEIKAKNEAQMALNKQQADLKEQERQKITQETAFATTPTDTQGILSSFISWVPVAPQKSGNYINAKFQYDQYSKLNAMTPTQLLDNLKQGQIGTEMDKLLSQNPNYIQAKGELDKIQKTNNINNSIKNIYGGVTGQTTQTPDYLGMVSKDLMTKLGLDKDMTSAEAFSQYVTGDQKIVDYTNQLSNVNRQIADTSKLINDGIKSLKAKKWDMPADALVVLLNSTFKDVNETLTNLNNTKTYLEADLKNASEMAFNRYNAVSKDIDNARTIKNSVISNLIQSQFNLAGKMQENELANQIARESMNDPYKAIPSMIEEYKKLGIPFTRSTQQIIQDFESSGKDLSTYLSELQGTIQSKPEYQKIRELQAGQLSDAQKLQMQYAQQSNMQDKSFGQQLALNDINFKQDIQKMLSQYDITKANWVTEFKRDLIKWGMSSEQADAIVRNETGQWNGVTGEKLLYADDGTFIKSTLKDTTNPNGGIECAEYISKMTGSRVWSTFEEKKKLNDEKTGTIGSIAVWRPVKTGDLAKYGHAGVIIGEEWDNWIIKSANYNVDWRISTDKVPKSEIEWYRSTDLWSKVGTKAKLSAEQQRITANQEKSAFRTNAVVKEFEEMYSQNKNLITSLASGNAPWDMASVFQFMKSLDPASVVRESEFELAAQATGIADRAASLYDKVVKWEKLTDTQRQEFGKLSSAYVQNKAKSYNRLYSDMERTFNYFWLPKELLPEKITVWGNENKNPVTNLTKEAVVDLYNRFKNNRP